MPNTLFIKPHYLVVGSGRWSDVICSVLNSMNRRVNRLPSLRMYDHETYGSYVDRAIRNFKSVKNYSIIWFCIPPGPHIPSLVEAAFRCNQNVIVEKPWYVEVNISSNLRILATTTGCSFAVHYQYCLLDSVADLCRNYSELDGCLFSGYFNIARSNANGIGALGNLGSHLLAISAHAVPRASIGKIQCAYGLDNRRSFKLTKDGDVLSFVDFTYSSEPIIQRFVASFEDSVADGGGEFGFPLADKVLHHLHQVSSSLVTEKR